MCLILEEIFLRVFKAVDWKVLGLLLGLPDDTLQAIESDSKCHQESMIQHWINTGRSYWSILIETLQGPVLGEISLANDISLLHLGNTTIMYYSLYQ